MTQLLNDLIEVPIILSTTIILLFIVAFVLVLIADVYKDKHPYQKNPFIGYATLTCATVLALAIGTKIRIFNISSKPLDYVIIQKTDTDIKISSKTMFIDDIKLKIKENINGGFIVEHNDKEYVIRDNQFNQN